MRAILPYCLLWAAGVSALLALMFWWQDASDLLVIAFLASRAVALIFLLKMRIGSKSAHEDHEMPHRRS
jgi:hypothetical protein